MIRLIGCGTLAIVVGLALLGGAAGAALTGPAGALLRPVSGARVSQPFGCTAFTSEPVDPACPGGHIHTGIDLAVALGTPVRATAAGRARVLHSSGGYGLHIVIDHGDGVASLYGHLSAVSIADGDDVVGGEVIGAVGSSGNSTGPHLHFEIRRHGVPEDPARDVSLP